MPTIAERVREVQDRIAAAAVRSGRRPEAVTLIAATKSRTPEEVEAAIAAGVAHVGENYVQEAVAKRAAVSMPASWRMIGHLQTNKVNAALAVFDSLDSLDSLRLARALHTRLERAERALDVLIEVRLGGEESKTGIDPTESDQLLAGLQQMATLRCLGLMTMPPPGDPTTARRYFAELRELAERLRRSSGLPLEVLSMGMSQDYEVAIEEGATHVRIGTALFGPRS